MITYKAKRKPFEETDSPKGSICMEMIPRLIDSAGAMAVRAENERMFFMGLELGLGVSDDDGRKAERQHLQVVSGIARDQ